MTPLLLLAVCMVDTLRPLVVRIHVKLTEVSKAQAEPAQVDSSFNAKREACPNVP